MAATVLLVSNDFDLDKELRELIGTTDTETRPDFSITRLNALKESAKFIGVRFASQDAERIGKVTQQHWDDVNVLLWTFASIEEMTPEMNKSVSVKGVLIMISSAAKHFPEVYQMIARSLFHRFELQNWGEVVPETLALAVAPEGTGQKRKRRGSGGGSRPVSQVRMATASHPIFGTAGIMHHIGLTTGVRPTNVISPDYQRPDFKVFGHNGIAIGTCWARQIAALRDGVHGAVIGGISGSKEDGAYSVVVSGLYDSIDRDLGDEIFYSSAGSQTTKDKEPNLQNNGTMALMQSITSSRPVRVLRASTGNWASAPRAGIRYDGLYQVVSFTEKQNNVGGRYVQFKLVRRTDQDPIAEFKPSVYQIREIGKVREGF